MAATSSSEGLEQSIGCSEPNSDEQLHDNHDSEKESLLRARQAQLKRAATVLHGTQQYEETDSANWQAAQKAAAEYMLSVVSALEQPGRGYSDHVTFQKISESLPVVDSLLTGLEFHFDETFTALNHVICLIKRISVLLLFAKTTEAHANDLEYLADQRIISCESNRSHFKRLESRAAWPTQTGAYDPATSRHDTRDMPTLQARQASRWRLRRAKAKEILLNEDHFAISLVVMRCYEMVAGYRQEIREHLPKCKEYLCQVLASSLTS